MLLDYQGWGGECSGKAQPGTIALRDYVRNQLDPWGTITGGIYGIYNCRPPSLHGEGRALDTGFAFEHDAPNPSGMAHVRWLMRHGEKLGIQEIIWDRVRYTNDNDPYGELYTGRSPHYDHTHTSQRWWFAKNLTLEKILEVCGTDPVKPLRVISPDDIVYKNREESAAVKRVQDALNYVMRTKIAEDGYFWDESRNLYLKWEQKVFGGGDGKPGRTGLRMLARKSGSFRSV